MPHQCTECGRTFADGSKQMLAGCPDCGGNKFQFRPKGSVEVPEEPAEPPSKSGGSSKPAEPTKTRTTTLREWARKVTPGSSSGGSSTPSASSTPNPSSTSKASSTAGSPSAGSSSPGSARGGTSTQSTSASGSTASGAGEAASTAEEQSTATSLDAFGENDESTDGQAHPPTADSAPRPTADSVHPSTADSAHPSTADPDDDAEAVEGADREDVAQADARSGIVGEDELPDRPATDADARPPEASAGTPDDDRPPEDTTRPDLAQLREELNDQFESIKVVEPGQYELNLMELYDREEYIIALQENGRYVIEVPDAWDATE